MATELVSMRLEGLEEVEKRLRELRQAGGDMRLLHQDIGEYLQLSARGRFDAQVDPEGNPWTPLSPRYARRKARKGGGEEILVLSTFLRDQLAYQADSDGLEFGTNRIYGPTHQFGDPDRNIPARPFLGLSDEDETEILNLALEHLRDAAA